MGSLRDQPGHGAVDVKNLDGPGDCLLKLSVTGLV